MLINQKIASTKVANRKQHAHRKHVDFFLNGKMHY